MVTLLLKKSYLHKNLKEIKFQDLWNGYGIFTTMRVIGKSPKIIATDKKTGKEIWSGKFCES